MSYLTTEKYKLLSLADLGKTNTSVVECISTLIDIDEPTTYSIKLVLSELIINGFIHGKAKKIDLEVTVNSKDSIVEFIVDDGGRGFDVEHSVKKPNVDSEQGRGIILVRAFSHDVVYNNIGNKVKATIRI